jgi:hypothetical protein
MQSTVKERTRIATSGSFAKGSSRQNRPVAECVSLPRSRASDVSQDALGQ